MIVIRSSIVICPGAVAGQVRWPILSIESTTTTLHLYLPIMSRVPYHTACAQPGIDWTKAARIAMNPVTSPFQSPFDNDCFPTEWDAGEFSVNAPTTSQHAAIKYPATVGKHLNRNPERDSFLRGGSQFHSIKQSTKSG